MNFRTTAILLVLLVGGLIFVYVANRDHTPEAPKEEYNPKGARLFDVSTDDVDKLTLRPADGKAIELAHQGGKWQITQPINWPASDSDVRDLVDEITGLRSHGHTDLGSIDVASTGLDKPRYTIEFTDRSGKATKLEVGNRSALGNDLYVKPEDKNVAELVGGGKLATQLDKTPDKLVASLRDKQLVRLTSSDVKQIELDVKGKKLVLNKVGEAWKIISPEQVPAESSEVSDLIFSLTGLKAEEFTDENAEESSARFDHPKAVAWLSSETPSTQPSTQSATAPAAHVGGVTITLGEFTNVDRDKIYVKVSDPGSIATATMTQATLDKLTGASALTLRDRKVLDVKPEEVSRIVIKTDLPATTQPSTRPAVLSEMIIQRKKQSMEMGPPLPAPPINGAPSTLPSTAPVPAAKPAPEPTSAPTTRPTTGPQAATLPTLVAPTIPTNLPVTAVPATQPTVPQPAVPTVVVPTTQPVAATPAPTPVTLPALPTPLISTSPWEIESAPKGAADQGQVEALLKKLDPLRADKYVPTATAATQPTANYTIEIVTEAPGGSATTHYLLRFTDPGGDKPLIGEYNGLSFEVSRDMLKNLAGDFKTRQPTASPETGPPNEGSQFQLPGH